MKNLILAGVAVVTLGSCFIFNEFVEGDGNIVVREYYVGSFDEVELEGIGKVVITQGSDEKVTVVAEQNILERLDVDEKGDSLVISQDYGVVLQPTQEPLYLVTMPVVERLHLSGAGTIAGSGTIDGDTVRLIVDGAGDIQVSLNVSEVISVISGTGNIELEGTAPLADHSISGTGDIEAIGLVSNVSEARISGVGDIEVHTVDYLRAVIDGVGDVRYRGSPTVDQNINGWGSVRPW